MARKVIDIGTVGNDGTGDSIRDSFRKVNDNFRELYSSLGLGDRLSFVGLDDTPENYIGQENAVVTVNQTTDGLNFRRLVGGAGIDITFEGSNIVLTNLLSDISGDFSPNLGGPLNAQSGGIRYIIGNLPDISSTEELATAKAAMTVKHSEPAAATSRMAVNKGYADTKISRAGTDAIDPATGQNDTSFGKMTGPLVLARDPLPEDDVEFDGLVAATKRYVDNSGFGSAVNLYVATTGADDRATSVSKNLQGRALSFAYRTLEAALKKAEEIILEAPIEIGPYKKVLTYGGGVNECSLKKIDSVPFAGTPAVTVMYMSVDTVEINNAGLNYFPGDTLTIVGGTSIQECTIRVLSVDAVPGSSGRGPVSTFEVITSGVYNSTGLPGSNNVSTNTDSAFGSGVRFNLTYNINNIQVTNGGSGYGLVSVRIVPALGDTTGTGAFGKADIVSGVIAGISLTDRGSGFTLGPTLVINLPRFFIETEGLRTDFTGNVISLTPEAIRTRDVREGLLLRGETSGALAQILGHAGVLSTGDGLTYPLGTTGSEIFDVDILSGRFIEGEVISYGDVSKRTQIGVFVEAGVYDENLPLRVPQNVAVIGDEFRRTIIRPKGAVPNVPLSGMSTSPWASLFFRRDPVIDGLRVAEQLYGYHYLSDPTIPIYPVFSNKGNKRSAAELIELNREFIKSQVIGWINYQILNDILPFTDSFEYNQSICKRDVGLIIDSMVFDLKYGGYARTISAALKYLVNASGYLAVTEQLSETTAGIQRIEILIQDVIDNTLISLVYTENGTQFDLNDPTNTLTLTDPQLIDQAYVSESGTGAAVTALTNAIIDVFTNSGAANYPKDNDKMDVFLMNDADIIRAVTCQGHGGFMMVLDPEGQILTKSPYCQESASFSKSIGRQTWAGGIFVDGFAGNQRFRIASSPTTTFLEVSGLLRVPQTPCSFIVSDTVYRINYVRNYNYGITDPTYSTAQFILDEVTPFTGAFGPLTVTITGSPGVAIVTSAIDHELQPGALVRFATSGSLPTGLLPNKDYYVLLDGFTNLTFKVTDDPSTIIPVTISSAGSGLHTSERIFEVLMPGNRSMLSNDFTQVNDLGYGLVVANGGLTEAVSMFTYYCQISYYAISGGQIRSIGGSSSHGNYGLVAEASDPLEVPTPAGLYHDLAQGATVYAASATTLNAKGNTIIYVNYDDYFPLNGSELEVNHNNRLVRYPISSVALDDLATKRARLTISSAGGLENAVPNGQRVTIRNNSFVVLTGNVVDVATRPSTALVLRDGVFVYRVLDFIDYDSTYDKETYNILSINLGTGLITTDIPHRQEVGLTVKFYKGTGVTYPSVIVPISETPISEGEIYYVVDVPSPTTLKISTTRGGGVLDLSGGPAYAGTGQLRTFGLALTQLRENYTYTVLNVYPKQPFRTPASLTACTVSAATPAVITSASHGLIAGTQIRFTYTTGGSLPTNWDEEDNFWVLSVDLLLNSFKVSSSPPIKATQLGVGGTLTGTTITGLTNTEGLLPGMRLYSRSSISITGVTGNGTTATLTFAQLPRPPFNIGQTINVAGVATVGFNNAAAIVTSCSTTTVSYANATVGTIVGSGTISDVTTGNLGTNPVVLSVASATSIIISNGGGSSNGTVVFDVEGLEAASNSASSNVRYGNLIGDQGQNTIAVIDLPFLEEQRVVGTKMVYEGREYLISGYQANPGGELYSLITFNQPLDISAIAYASPIALKSAVAVPSDKAIGTLTIRIALVRVTSHDFLEIGTGGYADTNYPAEIYGQAVNDFNGVPLYVTDYDAEGEPVTRAQVQERDVGRCFFVTTDQYGNFAVGPFFKVDQGTGTVTFAASIALSQLDGLGFKRGATISEFSVDDSMADAGNDAVPTEGAVRGYIDRRLGVSHGGASVLTNNLIPVNTGGFMALTGQLPMKGNMDMSDNRIINVATPILPNDAARLEDINITNLSDDDGNLLFNFLNVRAGQIAAFTGSNNTIINVEPVGDVIFDIQTGDSSTNVIRTSISADSIVNADINSAAGIVQSKLVMNDAGTRANAVGITQADKGLASFDSSQFTTTNGWATIKDTGIALAKLPNLPSNTVVGNSNPAAPDVPSSVNFSTVVDVGGAIKKSQFSSGTGYIKRINTGAGNFTADGHYSLIDDATGVIASTLVRRDANGDFAGRIITADEFKTNTTSTGTYTALKADQVSVSSGYTNLYGYNGGGGSLFAAVQAGAGTSLNKNNYNNDSHEFRNQSASISFATLDASGFNIGTRTLTCGAITTGSSTTSGTITGQWTLADAPGGASRVNTTFQATYAADLAEWYEGDAEYEVGTVLVFGGDKEVTVDTVVENTRVAGVVSNTAAYSMYGACPGLKNQIALQGRVPVKVIGKIIKGDLLITSSIAGVAMAATGDVKTGSVIGKAIESYDSEEVGMIQVSVGRT